MKIIFASNYFNHHQKALSEALYRLTNGNYYFIATEKMETERLNMGWGMNEYPNYVLESYLSKEAQHYCQTLIDDADVVIIGSAPNKLIKNRLKKGKLTFRYSERLYKKKCEWYTLPLRFIKYFFKYNIYKNYYLLTASAYTAADYAKTFSYLDKSYKWGYFPETKIYENMDKLIQNKIPNSLLWTARMIDWKHPEQAVFVAKKLKQDGYNIQLNLIGNGILEEEIKKLIEEEGITDCVCLLGAMSPDEVRKYMEQTEIFMFTSDRNEGWGAVLNEAMNSGCAVVASHAIGSVPFLLEDGENGFIYKDGDLEDLYLKVKNLLDNPDKRREMGKKAYETLIDEWNAENAAERFCMLAQSILDGDKKSELFEQGICSKSKILKDSWYNG